MALGIQITIEDVTREETCDKTICLLGSIKVLGEKGTAAGMLGVEADQVVDTELVGNCNKCELYPYLRSREA